jgi:two-component system, NtrC family, sensor kinase
VDGGADARARRQLEWAALGMFVGLTPYLCLALLPGWLGIRFEPFAWLAVLPVAAIPLALLAALREYRLWDLEPIARDSLSATLVLVSGGLIFAFTNRLLTSYGGGLRNLLAFATGVLLVVLLQPVRVKAAQSLDQWFHHGRPPPRWLLTHSTLDLVSATDPSDLLRRLSDALHEGMEMEPVATYLHGSGDRLHRVTSSADPVPDELPADTLMSPFPGPHEQALDAAGYVVRIPLERAGTVHGLLYLGRRRGLYPLGAEGLEVVATFAAQAALSLESARRLDDLRRQAEEYRILHANTQRIIESSAAAIVVCDSAGRILSANTEAAGIFGRGREELVGDSLRSLLELPDGWERQLPIYAVNTEARSLGEPPRQLILAVSVLELDSGSFDGRVVVLQDVTELRTLQDRVREQERLAALGRLASGLAHEINTPLTGIASFAQMLGELTPAEDPRSRLVAKLVDQSFRVSRIVANLREAVRGSRGSRSVLDLRRVAERAAHDAARSLGAAERLSVELQPGEVMVWGAPGPVELAVSNLVRNAFEASPPSAAVRLAVALDGDWGVVEVDDHGPGIPEALRARVFEAFFTTKTERGGTGLGLAITRDMIAQLGGEVSLASLPEGGTRASIRLPRWEVPAPSS